MPSVPSHRESTSTWLIIILVGLAPGFLLDPTLVARSISPHTSDSLEVPSFVDLGVLKPREKQTITLRIRNAGGRRINLRPVDTDCGCLVVNNAPTTIQAGQSSTIKVSIEAPSVPSEFSRSLLIRPTDEGLAWKTVVQGRVAAPVWSDPAALDLEFGERVTAEARLKIQHVDEVQLGRLVPTSPSIQIVDSRKLNDGVELRIRVTEDRKENQAADEDALQVFVKGNSTKPILLIPIRPRSRTQISYVPQRLEFPQFDVELANSNKIRRVLAVVIPPDRLAHDAQVKLLVPWARIVAEKSEGSTLRLEVEFDGRVMPNEFHQAVLSTSLPDQPIDQELLASGYRARM